MGDMYLDNRTIIFVGAAVAFIVAQAMVLLSLSLRKYRGPGLWAVGSCGLAICSLAISLQGHLPPLFGVVIANGGIMICLCLVCHGLVVFLRQRHRLWVYLPACLATILGFAYFTLWQPSFVGRALAFSLAYGYLMGDMAWVLYRQQDDRREPCFLFVLITLITPVVLNALRVGVVLGDPRVAQNLMQPGIFGALVLMLYILNSVALFVGLITLASSRFSRELEQANRDLERLSTQDGLTGLYNRRYLDQILDQETRREAREHSVLSLILLDIDHFKAYNDTYGHQAGDDCLRALAATISQTFRRPADIAARYGGEEFAVVLPGTDLAGAWHMAETLRLAVHGRSILHAGSPVAPVVTISLGVASIMPQPGNRCHSLLAQADQALYQAKNQGRNRAVAADDSSDTPDDRLGSAPREKACA